MRLWFEDNLYWDVCWGAHDDVSHEVHPLRSSNVHQKFILNCINGCNFEINCTSACKVI
jgi:hypothetical protein